MRKEHTTPVDPEAKELLLTHFKLFNPGEKEPDEETLAAWGGMILHRALTQQVKAKRVFTGSAKVS